MFPARNGWCSCAIPICATTSRRCVQPKPLLSQNLPSQFTSFVGRGAQLTEVRELLAENRLVTLTGAGGVGKTRLAVQVADQLAGEFADGVWYVDLAPITDPELVPVTVARALGLPDQPGRSTMDTLLRFVRDRQMLVVLDNCEHLLDASAELVVALLGGAPGLTLLATSREPIGVTGEVTWRVPSLSLADEADRVVHRPRAPGPARFHRHRRQRRRGGRDLRAPRRDAAGDRAGGRAGAGVVAGRDPRQPA